LTYLLRRDQPLPEELKTVARAEFEGAVLDLSLFPRGRDIGIHEARKRFKKLRALLRLIRRDLDDFPAQNSRIRDIARELSGARDAAVLHKAFDATFQDLAIPAVASARRMLPEGTGEQEPTHDDRTAGLLARLREGYAAVALWGIRPGTVAHGATRSYRLGRRALKAAATDATNDDFHEWRKRVKDHWYHMRLLQEQSAAANARRAGLKELSDLLGDANDLCLLEAALLAADPTVLQRVASRKTALRDQAIGLGRAIYEDQPAAFCQRVLAPVLAR